MQLNFKAEWNDSVLVACTLNIASLKPFSKYYKPEIRKPLRKNTQKFISLKYSTFCFMFLCGYQSPMLTTVFDN